jgi:predicted acylesterase/phospholipase RssA
MPAYRSFDQHLSPDSGPKRILSLDGGGLRGVLTVQVLRKLEAQLRQRFADPQMCLCDYFDLIAGTSTGAIIAGGLSLGMTVDQIEKHYLDLGAKVFKRSFWRQGLTQEKYDADDVAAALRRVFGERLLNSRDFRTGLLVVAKRLDSGSTWVLTNNPQAKYFKARPGSTAIPNGEYPLWQVVRASTAAPTFFSPEEIRIHSDAAADRKDTVGLFVDGGVSPHNNPALQAVMAATMQGYAFGWPVGADRLLVVSVGTGKANPNVGTGGLASLPAAQGLLALRSLMEDCSDLVETMMQWLSTSATAREIDREMGLAGPAPGGQPLLTYQRYNAMFTGKWFKDALGQDVSEDFLRRMEEMDVPANIDSLRDVGRRVAERQVDDSHLPAAFDAGVRV